MKSREIRPGSIAKKKDREAAVRKQISRETERHSRKVSTLAKQTEAARQIADDGQRALALARIAGQRGDETAKHKNKITDYNERIRAIWW